MTLPVKGHITITQEVDGKKSPFIIAFKGDDLQLGKGSLEIHSQVGVLKEDQSGYDYIADPEPFSTINDIAPILNPNVRMLDNMGKEFSCFDTFQQLAKICDLVWTQVIGTTGEFTPGSTGIHGITGCFCYTGMHSDGACEFYTGIHG